MHIWENFKVSLFIFGSSQLVNWWVEKGSSKKKRRRKSSSWCGKLKGSWESKWRKKKGLSQHKIKRKVSFWRWQSLTTKKIVLLILKSRKLLRSKKKSFSAQHFPSFITHRKNFRASIICRMEVTHSLERKLFHLHRSLLFFYSSEKDEN